MDIAVQPETALVFAPPQDQVDAILDQLTDHRFTLRDIAHHHRVTFAALVTWLNRPEIKARFDALAQASIAHTRLVATRYLPQALRVNASILAAFLNQRAPARQPATEATSNQVPQSAAPALGGPTVPVGLPKTPQPRQPQSAAQPLNHRSAEMAQRAAAFILRAARLPNWSKHPRSSTPPRERQASPREPHPAPPLADLISRALNALKNISVAPGPTAQLDAPAESSQHPPESSNPDQSENPNALTNDLSQPERSESTATCNESPRRSRWNPRPVHAHGSVAVPKQRQSAGRCSNPRPRQRSPTSPAPPHRVHKHPARPKFANVVTCSAHPALKLMRPGARSVRKLRFAPRSSAAKAVRLH